MLRASFRGKEADWAEDPFFKRKGPQPQPHLLKKKSSSSTSLLKKAPHSQIGTVRANEP